MSNYHVPVMLSECLEGLNINPNGTFVDVTFGGGGHSRAILERLDKGRLIAFDQDDDAQANALKDPRFTLVNHNFRYLKRFLRYHEAIPVDGILADLGISSHQIDEAERGFAHRFDAELDMRMNRQSGLSAADLINEGSEENLQRIFRLYGELKQSRAIAATLVASRVKAPIRTTGELKSALARFAPRGKENQFHSQVFQALRIEVNGELDVLKEMLEQSAEVLAPGGRLVVMSYHSLEDRMVKNFMQTGSVEGEEVRDLYGNRLRPLEPFGKTIKADNEEIERNSRARSARLRIAVKR
ncbi:MAG: 16S rRNA (cytosine(1402)-N(4))-methyltransferase RsmH [Bacteroidota bacterium]|nr:16S rRNA (cytosine(1402)-N(4))-methyltransferase RsmH [Bacteroidota bacterium]MDX5431547.1 16S rRNA (cytosine(1402)-N(4))-methyltransferase RsmH [Bacteroidota bacterium]MDX5470268.1 16S rRNA (cytosine(1402)-N(4))-methyltransferase RsmH [Bacteroidota bacterium]